MPHDPYRALYLHIPFCASRCAYCDFATRAVERDSPEISAYVEDMVMQIRRAGKEGELASIETVYLGGGTPTHTGTKHLSQILYTLGLTMHLTDEVECTVEANPESLDERLVRDLWALGANRLSIGVQSFVDGLLSVLGRAHTADGARRAVEAALSRFENVSVDVMCGLPGQSLEQFEATLREAVNLGVAHVSVYPLTVEDHTLFANMVASGAMSEPDDDVEADMMRLASEVLGSSGFARYEVANYARPGFESRHNTAYWSGLPYLGIGTSAATMTQNSERRMRVQDGRVTDDLDARQMAAEDLMLAMRMTRGVDSALLGRAERLLPNARATLDGLVARGLARYEAASGAYAPTELGWLCGNELYGALYELAP